VRGCVVRAGAPARVVGGRGVRVEELQAERFLDLLEVRALVRIGERQRVAGRVVASRAADAVHVAVEAVRDFVVDDQADRLDVEPARGDVGGDEHLDAAGAERFDRGGAVLLRSIGVDRDGTQTRRVELPRETVAADLRVDEDDGRLVELAQVLREERRLLARRQDPRLVRDRLRRAAPRSDLDEHGARRQRVREPHHLVRHRRREQHRLACGRRRQRLRDAPHVGPEAHVHHAIGFVEDEDLELREVADAAAHVIQQPPGRGDDDVDAGLQRAGLRLDRHAAVDGDARHRRVIGEALDLVVDLGRELARGREDQRARDAARRAVAFAVLAQQARQDRQQIRGGLAGAGLRAADYVAAVERVRQHRALNRRRLFEAALIERVEQVGVGDERAERHRGGIEGRRFARRRLRRRGRRRTLRAATAAGTTTSTPRLALRSVGFRVSGQGP
jgi:hypothetical protein